MEQRSATQAHQNPQPQNQQATSQVSPQEPSQQSVSQQNAEKSADRPVEPQNPPSDRQPEHPAKQQPESNTQPQTGNKNKQKSNKSWGKGLSSWRFPKINFSLINFFSISFKRSGSAKPRNWLVIWLLIIMSSYICMGYFLSVLMTIPNRQILAIAGFIIMGILPIITAFAEYSLMKWGYLLSGLLVIGAFIFWLRMRFYLTVLAIIGWIGITMVAFVGEYLLKQKRKLIMAIAMVTAPCLAGLGIGWQLWSLAARHLS